MKISKTQLIVLSTIAIAAIGYFVYTKYKKDVSNARETATNTNTMTNISNAEIVAQLRKEEADKKAFQDNLIAVAHGRG